MCFREYAKKTVFIYLETGLDELIKRLGDITTRGIAMDKDIGIAKLYSKRKPLYEKYADITVDCTKLTPEECVKAILKKIRNGEKNR